MPSEIANGLRSISLPTIIQIGTIAAALVGQWYVMSAQVETVTRQIEANSAQIVALDRRLNDMEREQATAAVRFENLRDIVFELRRQTGVRSFSPSTPAKN